MLKARMVIIKFGDGVQLFRAVERVRGGVRNTALAPIRKSPDNLYFLPCGHPNCLEFSCSMVLFVILNQESGLSTNYFNLREPATREQGF